MVKPGGKINLTRLLAKKSPNCIGKNQLTLTPLNAIQDSFKKIVATGENIKPRRDNNGILTIGIEDFFTKQNSLEL